MNTKDIEKLADLARINVSPEERLGFLEDMKSILSYVSEIQEVDVGEAKPLIGELKNVFREDSSPHLSGAYTEDILEEMPKKEKGYLKVKKIL